MGKKNKIGVKINQRTGKIKFRKTYTDSQKPLQHENNNKTTNGGN